MQILHFLQTGAGRAIRVVAGVLLLGYGILTPTLPGIVAMMAGVMSFVTGLAGLPAPEAPHNP